MRQTQYHTSGHASLKKSTFQKNFEKAYGEESFNDDFLITATSAESIHNITNPKLNINRSWAMPNSNTFDIKPIGELLSRYIKLDQYSIDPFANKNRLAQICNDLDPQHNCQFQLDAIDFLKTHHDGHVDLVLYDPPYSPRQVSECYKSLGKTVNMQTTQASYWTNQKKEIGRIVKAGGHVITCGWNSGGIGKKYGFEIVEILMVAHGGWHNDTIVTVERKIS